MNSLKIIKSITDTCCYCEKSMVDFEKTFDHFIPSSKGGKNTNNNKLVCCVSCNRMKADYLPNEWLNILEFQIREYNKTYIIPIYENLKKIIAKKEAEKYTFEKPKKVRSNESANDKLRKSGTNLSFKNWIDFENKKKEPKVVNKTDIKLPKLKIESDGIFFEYNHIGELICPVDENTNKGDYVYFNETTLRYAIYEKHLRFKIRYYIPSYIQDKIIYNNNKPNGFDYRIILDKQTENFHEND